jgi:hypothetical protein
LIMLALGLLLGLVALVITLVLRQVAITILVVIAPLAFIMWVLPNTENFFKFWYQNLLRAVLMYPLIILILGAGRLVEASVVGNNSSGGFESAVGMLAPTLAFLLIPATFKAAGSLMTAGAGFVMGRAGGARSSIRGSEWGKGLREDQKLRLQRYQNSKNKGLKYLGHAGQGRVFGTIGQGNKVRASRSTTQGMDEMRKRFESDGSITTGDLLNFASGKLDKVNNKYLKSQAGNAMAVGAAHRMVAETGLYRPDMAATLNASGLATGAKEFIHNYTRDGQGYSKISQSSPVLAAAPLSAWKQRSVLDPKTGKQKLETYLDGSVFDTPDGEAAKATLEATLPSTSPSSFGKLKEHGIKQLSELSRTTGGKLGMVHINTSAITGQANSNVAAEVSDASRKTMFDELQKLHKESRSWATDASLTDEQRAEVQKNAEHIDELWGAAQKTFNVVRRESDGTLISDGTIQRPGVETPQPQTTTHQEEGSGPQDTPPTGPMGTF